MVSRKQIAELSEVSKVLMCPVCQDRLRLNISPEASLFCNGCGEEYQVFNGIPILISKEHASEIEMQIQIYENQPVRSEVDSHVPFVKKHLSFIKNRLDLEDKIIVDLGGGEGLLNSHLGEARNVIVVDIALPRLVQGISRKRRNNIYVCADIQSPAINLQADLVLLLSVLEHVHSPEDTLGNAAHMLRQGGALVAFVPICNLPFPRLATFMFRKIKRIDIVRANREHLRVYSTNLILNQVKMAGFTIEDLKHQSAFNEFGLTKWFVNYANRSNVLDFLFASGIYILARKN